MGNDNTKISNNQSENFKAMNEIPCVMYEGTSMTYDV